MHIVKCIWVLRTSPNFSIYNNLIIYSNIFLANFLFHLAST